MTEEVKRYKAAMFPAVVEAMLKQRDDPAIDSRVSLMALRFLESRPVGTLRTRATQDEIEALLQHREAALAARRQ